MLIAMDDPRAKTFFDGISELIDCEDPTAELKMEITAQHIQQAVNTGKYPIEIVLNDKTSKIVHRSNIDMTGIYADEHARKPSIFMSHSPELIDWLMDLSVDSPPITLFISLAIYNEQLFNPKVLRLRHEITETLDK